MRLASILGFLMIAMFACRPARKVQKIQSAISKIDTTSIVRIKDRSLDSAKQATLVYNKVLKNKIDFKTFNAKVRVQYDDNSGGDEATAFLRLQKDSLMWLSLRGALGIEGFRVLISRDSVKVM